jgi:hypothetical protein
MKKYSFSFLLLLLFAAGCQQNSNYHRVWLLSADSYKQYLGGLDGDIQAIDLRGDGRKPQFSSEAFLNLKPDGTYTSYLATYQEGKWKLGANSLLLMPLKGDPIEFEVRSIRNDTLKLYYSGHGMSYDFKGYPNKFEKEADDPFTAANNTWRIDAAHKESDKEIDRRIENHFLFMEKYFRWGGSKNVRDVAVDIVPGPFSLYGNGFGLPRYNQQDILWRNHFYDDEDSRKAYDRLEGLFREKYIFWDRTPNKFLMFADAYRQLQEWVK